MKILTLHVMPRIVRLNTALTMLLSLAMDTAGPAIGGNSMTMIEEVILHYLKPKSSAGLQAAPSMLYLHSTTTVMTAMRSNIETERGERRGHDPVNTNNLKPKSSAGLQAVPSMLYLHSTTTVMTAMRSNGERGERRGQDPVNTNNL